MNGDEDLGEDITMKGKKFHYAQQAAGSLAQGQWALDTCSATVTTNCQPVCDETNTVGCTEAAAPIPPPRDRFEAKWTHDKAPN